MSAFLCFTAVRGKEWFYDCYPTTRSTFVGLNGLETLLMILSAQQWNNRKYLVLDSAS